MFKSIAIVLITLSVMLGSLVMLAHGYAIAKKGIDGYACTVNGLEDTCIK